MNSPSPWARKVVAHKLVAGEGARVGVARRGAARLDVHTPRQHWVHPRLGPGGGGEGVEGRHHPSWVGWRRGGTVRLHPHM
eukprot:198438-Chlamydomonas_euryale.AAC.1